VEAKALADCGSVDLQCKLLHLGQHNFQGDLAESLRLQGRW